MASSKKSSNQSKKTNREREAKAREAEAEREEHLNNLRTDIICVVIVVFALLLFISNMGFGGTVGQAVSNFFFGLFGLVSYALPLVIIFLSVFSFPSMREKFKGNVQRIIGFSVMIVAIGLFSNLLVNGKTIITPAESYSFSFAEHNGGGLFGGIFSYFFVKWFGLIGAYIIAVAAILVALILITNKLFMRMFTEKTYDSTEKVVNKVKEINSEENRQARKQRRMDKKAPKGVTGDTRVGGSEAINSAGSGDEMHELHPEDADQLVTSRKRFALNSDGEVSPESDSAVEKELSSNVREIRGEQSYSENSSFPISGDFEHDDQPAAFTPENAYPVTPEKKRTVTKAAEPQASEDIGKEIEQNTSASENQPSKPYVFPPTDLLKLTKSGVKNKEAELRNTAMKLEETLASFGVSAHVTNVACGPAVTRYELKPDVGVKVSKIVNLQDDIKLNLAAADIRIEAPVPGTSLVGIEVPNKEASAVSFRELIESDEFRKSSGKMVFAVGKDLGGKIKVTDISKMPHLLIAGATGSGKSVCINTIIMSILFKYDPKDVKMILIDPKVVELSVYNGIPHLLIPVVTDPKKAAGSLNWAVNEMTLRYEKFANVGVRDLEGYNNKMKADKVFTEVLPKIVVIVDELADLMMTASNEVEASICRLAQLARAAGIHLIIATQRPSVDVITGLIKANMPSRIAFSVTSNVDSRTILDMAGAEKLLGKGDMLFYPQGLPKPERVQGAFVSDDEVSKVVDFIKRENGVFKGDAEIANSIENSSLASVSGGTSSSEAESDNGMDPLVYDAAKIIVDKEKASIGSLQRYLKIGFNRAARIMEQLEELGVVGPEMGTKPRAVLMDAQALEELLSNH